MSSAALDFTYRYPFASDLVESERGSALQLATSNAKLENPHFFAGHIIHPRELGISLGVLTKVVRTHFFLPVPQLLDPVVTSNESVLRFEGFSGCCGVYARADFDESGFDCDVLRSGTTNVDFNDQMRNALNRIHDDTPTRLSVGRDGVELSNDAETVFEKKVKLPIRWVKGFCEVHIFQSGMTLKLEASGIEARSFMKSLPAVSPKKPSYVVRTGKALRLSQRPGKGAVQFVGTHRVKVLEPLMPCCEKLRIWSDEDTGVVGWELVLKSGRFLLLVSPEIYRGFSGEGQALLSLASADGEKLLKAVQAALKWQSIIDPEALADSLGIGVDDVTSALVTLGSRGLTGYDLHEEAYFHRELPFDMEQIEKLQPRLKNARKLIEDKKIKLLVQRDTEDADFEVEGTGVNHLVRLRPEGDKCTCPWFNKHMGQRGPCKHVLAAQLMQDESD
jgi:hypothetical protein